VRAQEAHLPAPPVRPGAGGRADVQQIPGGLRLGAYREPGEGGEV